MCWVTAQLGKEVGVTCINAHYRREEICIARSSVLLPCFTIIVLLLLRSGNYQIASSWRFRCGESRCFDTIICLSRNDPSLSNKPILQQQLQCFWVA